MSCIVTPSDNANLARNRTSAPPLNTPVNTRLSQIINNCDSVQLTRAKQRVRVSSFGNLFSPVRWAQREELDDRMNSVLKRVHC